MGIICGSIHDNIKVAYKYYILAVEQYMGEYIYTYIIFYFLIQGSTFSNFKV
jgi:hypothetical protein